MSDRSLALCMVVKDEANRIADCLDPLVDRVDQVVIVDTGSVDGTPELLRQRYGIVPLTGELREESCFTKSVQRNRAYELAGTAWICGLDADERLDPRTLDAFRKRPRDAEVAGYFGSWINHVDGEAPFEDYKLFLFRKGFRKVGLVHENVQVDVRDRGAQALWLDGLEVRHFPEPEKHAAKTDFYRRRLECAIRREPHWYRYHWFRGYMEYQSGRWREAARFLSVAAASNSPRFPVESLNSRMVLADIHARAGRRAEAEEQLQAALRFYSGVQGDFEVRINFRMKSWLEGALAACRANALERIRAYRFAR
jgi:glycosyltransferase involved in cell wall biosynthesis